MLMCRVLSARYLAKVMVPGTSGPLFGAFCESVFQYLLHSGRGPGLPFADEWSSAGSTGHLRSGGAETRDLCIPGLLPSFGTS